ncbi:MAG TPA: nickel pincer cofactor biosynthesis protein LarC [Anaerolineae bacterium]|nr:nickel pincer cofactor biosynthesis protein LarC [Anaerolineae bacterium]
MIAYLDLPAGLSGDMFLGCLVDAGWSIEALRATLDALGLPAGSWDVRAEQVRRGPLRATLVHVDVAETTQHRHLSDIRAIIERSSLAPSVQAHAIATFARLAMAEAHVHGEPVEQVHFHEVGALDSIVDIVGAAAGLHSLGIEQLYASGAPLGSGWVQSAHGQIPLPAPATLELLTAAQAPTRPAPGPGELVTPTGAALLAQFARFEQPEMRLARIGIGAGQRDPAWPNVARLMVGEPLAAGPMVEIATNIDDMNPELYGAVTQRLFAAGARDVWLTPVQMKKGRPGIVLSLIAPAALESTLSDLLLRETTTLGVRVHAIRRHEAGREQRTVDTRYGPVQVKLKLIDGAVWGVMPEYDDCLRVAEVAGIPVRLVYDEARAQWAVGSGQ